ncbi:DUF4393 domain-containing protein [Haloechinothrix sp. YIM 98757]|uniref:DUF4393 domain-containing protein n=1 Tax=Haloechinothrix aidingensis TaxID=2752311 RepID=A0A838ADZ3_9PSEU|nr:Abi-alpha family protein [Haloechinothrix aidingensis]MBA0127348.1 DUF4393 domain-containing protein [Haloechinothrix aidingensis]
MAERDTGQDAGHGRSAGGQGLGDALNIPVRLAGTALSVAGRLGTDVATHAVSVSRDVLAGAQEGRPPAELAGVVLHGWVRGVRKALGVDSGGYDAGERFDGYVPPRATPLPGQERPAVVEMPSTPANGRTAQGAPSELRQRGQELLYRSTALDDPDEHPALAVILRELSPDEARIIRYLAAAGPQALVDVLAHNPMSRKQREMLHHFSLLGREAGCIRPGRVPVYLDNLVRLGLVHVRPYRLRGQPSYELLYAQPEVKQIRRPGGRLVRLRIVHKGVELSEFGKELFCQCLETEEHRIATSPGRL